MVADPIEAAVAAALAAARGRILVGFSGGLDSTVLLHAAASAVGDRRRLIAVHVDHGLQSVSASWARHCRVVCERSGIACLVERVRIPTTGESVEQAARRARYRAFAARIDAGDLLLLAHHCDDQAETVLWRLLRGGGSRALAGMPARRTIGAGELKRPLLPFARSELVAWARARHLEWIDDASNTELRFERNFLRHAVLPVLRRQWPNAERRLVGAAARARAEAAWLETTLDERLDATGASRTWLPIALLDGTDSAILLLRRWLERAGLPGVRERVLHEIVRQAQASAERSPVVHVGDAVSVRRHDGGLHLVRSFAAPPAQRVWQLECGLGWQDGTLEAHRGPGIDGSLAAVTVEPRRGGERLRLPGQRGSRSVKRLLHDAHVPRWLRVHYPLVYVDERLAAVPGIAIDAAFVDASAHGWQLSWSALEDAG